MRAAFSSPGMSVWGIAASPSSISLAACSQCRRRKRGGQSPPSSIPARSTISWSCGTSSSASAITSRPVATRRSCCADICNGATRSSSVSTACSPSRSGTSLPRSCFWLARRRAGKPLFYYPMADGVLFGSEPKVILAHPAVRPRVNKDGFRELLVLAKNPEVTIYAGMCEVRPGEVVHANRNGLTKRRYWKLTAREHEDDLPRTIRTVAELLEDIVQRQIVADVPLCSLLSGGLDSSSVTALAHRAIFIRQGGRIRSFSVDFADHGAAFVAGDFHKSSDTPFVRDFVAHVGCNHTAVVLDSRELANRDMNRAVIRASDFPLSLSGDMFSSLYRLFQAVRTESTVALSGESADEVFGGYAWFHDPEAVEAATFPWLATTGGTFDGAGVLDADLLEQLKLPEFEADSYAQAIAETPLHNGEDAVERRMREISYLHLTRFVQFLLDRKARMSMAVGLEVRVPFCDHRLVEYVFNIPWHLKTFDGREKSILRAATREL